MRLIPTPPKGVLETCHIILAPLDEQHEATAYSILELRMVNNIDSLRTNNLIVQTES